MSWTQVHVSGINTDLQLDDDALEAALNELFQLSETTTDWAGEGTSTFKRLASDNNNNNHHQQLRGYGFLSFLSARGAATAIQKIQNAPKPCHLGTLHAELSRQSTKGSNSNNINKTGKQQGNNNNNNNNKDDTRDVRLRRKRAPPAGKHPVKTSSNVAKLYRG